MYNGMLDLCASEYERNEAKLGLLRLKNVFTISAVYSITQYSVPDYSTVLYDVTLIHLR